MDYNIVNLHLKKKNTLYFPLFIRAHNFCLN